MTEHTVPVSCWPFSLFKMKTLRDFLKRLQMDSRLMFPNLAVGENHLESSVPPQNLNKSVLGMEPENI